jgi:hypothetical protein
MFWWYRAHDNRNFARVWRNGRARECSPRHKYLACAYSLQGLPLLQAPFTVLKLCQFALARKRFGIIDWL